MRLVALVLAVLLGQHTGFAQFNGGISIASGVSNFIPGNFSPKSSLYVVPMPVSMTVGTLLPIFDKDLQLWVYARAELGVGKGLAVGPGIRLYSSRNLGVQSSLKPYLDIYAGMLQFATNGTAPPMEYRSSNTFASVGASYCMFTNQSLEVFVGLIDRYDNTDYLSNKHYGYYLGVGYSFLIPGERPLKMPKHRFKRKKMTSCPYRYRW